MVNWAGQASLLETWLVPWTSTSNTSSSEWPPRTSLVHIPFSRLHPPGAGPLSLYLENLCSFFRPCFSKCGFQTGNTSAWSPYTGRVSGPILCCAKSLQSCLTLCDPIDCSLPGSSVHGILQARALEWAAMPSSSGSSHPRPTDWRSADEQDLKLISKHIQFWDASLQVSGSWICLHITPLLGVC